MSESVEPKFRRSYQGPIILFLVLGVGAAVAALAIDHRKPAPVPLRVLPEVVDLGALRQLETRQVDLEIRNDADHPVCVTNVATSCGCTVPAWKQLTLQPRQRVVLPVNLSTGHGDGVVERTVTVYVRDASQLGGIRPIESRIRALVRPDLVIEPHRLDLGEIPADEPVTASVRIKRHGMQETLDVQTVRTTHECLLGRLQADGSSDGAEMTATLNPSLYSNRYFSGEIQITTNSPGMPVIRVPVSAKIERPFLFSPTSVFIVTRAGDMTDAPGSADLRIQEPDGGELPELEFAFASAAFEATPLAPTIRGELTVRIHVRAGNALREMEDRLIIARNAGSDVVASIPVRYLDLRASRIASIGE